MSSSWFLNSIPNGEIGDFYLLINAPTYSIVSCSIYETVRHARDRRWSKIAQHLPGRTDNEIKNYWRTRVQKQARQLKVDSNSKKFLEAIRTFWIPRLVEQMEQNNPSTSSITNSQTNLVNNYSDSELPLQVKNSGSNLAAQNLTVGKNNAEILIEDYYSVGFPSSCYDENEMQEMDGQDGSLSQCHAAGIDWFGEDLGSTFWNTDELWQFRKWEELGM